MRTVLAAAVGVFLLALLPGPSRAAEQISLPGVGQLVVHRPPADVSSVAMFLSGRKGWGPSETAITAELNKAGALVIGIDTATIEKNYGHGSSCLFLAGSLQDIARAAEKELALPTYIEPVLMGHAEGASYAYGVIAEAPENTFKGGLGLGFDPAAVIPRALCKGSGGLKAKAAAQGFALEPAAALSAPFTVLQGETDPATPAAVQAFFSGIDQTRVVTLAGQGRDFTDPQLFSGPLVDEFGAIARAELLSDAPPAEAAGSGLDDLPITEVQDPDVPEGDTFAIFYSGDGGWAGLDSGVSSELARRGIPVVGVSSLSYFWQSRTPEQVAADADRIARFYLEHWHKKKFMLVGYSFGADIVPFAANRLDAENRPALKSLALIGPSHAATFEFHVSDWLTDSSAGTPTRPEVEKLSPLPVFCVHGADEQDSLCPDLKGPGVTDVAMGGGHHLDGAYAEIAQRISPGSGG